jgi:hypothetical protein
VAHKVEAMALPQFCSTDSPFLAPIFDSIVQRLRQKNLLQHGRYLIYTMKGADHAGETDKGRPEVSDSNVEHRCNLRHTAT